MNFYQFMTLYYLHIHLAILYSRIVKREQLETRQSKDNEIVPQYVIKLEVYFRDQASSVLY